MKIAIASSSSVGLALIPNLLAAGHEIVGFITTPDAQIGRGKSLSPNPFARQVATLYANLPLSKPNNRQELHEVLIAMGADLIITAAYGRLIKAEELAIPKFGWINLHYSLLPKWRGAAPIQRSLMMGERAGGYTIFQLDAGMDTGPIFLQKEISYGENEGTEELLQRFSELAAVDLIPLLQDIESGIIPTPQPVHMDADFGHAPKIEKHEGRITPEVLTAAARGKYLAMRGNPGVFIELSSGRLKIVQAKFEERMNLSEDFAPAISPASDGLRLRLSDGVMTLQRVVPAGKSEMSASDYFRGVRGELSWAE